MVKEWSFNRWCWNNWVPTCKRMKLEPMFTPYKKLNSKWIKEFTVRAKSIKFLEGNLGIDKSL